MNATLKKDRVRVYRYLSTTSFLYIALAILLVSTLFCNYILLKSLNEFDTIDDLRLDVKSLEFQSSYRKLEPILDDKASSNVAQKSSSGISSYNEMLFTTTDITEPYVSLLILTQSKFLLFGELLRSILQQKFSNFEILIVDTGCLTVTKEVINFYLMTESKNPKKIPHKYLQACDNPGYAMSNNRGAALASDSSKWLLLLNDDIIFQNETFVERMLHVVENQPKAAGAGCKLVDSKGSRLLEAGSILFQDGSAQGFGRDRSDYNAPEYSFPRPIDYVSGACLMVNKQIFNDYGGLDWKQFPNYYEDTDLQMHIQHDLGMEVWFQPDSIALHNEHASFGKADSTSLMQRNQKLFLKKWKSALLNHIPNPWASGEHQRSISLLKGSDTRLRGEGKAAILILDQNLPNRFRGQGFSRAYGNIKMLAELGHRITIAPFYDNTETWCGQECLADIRDLGVEVVTDSWENFVESRMGFFKILIVSRPVTFEVSLSRWKKFFEKNPMSLIYDCEALWYLRDEEYLRVYSEGVQFPSLVNTVDAQSLSEYDNILKEIVAGRKVRKEVLASLIKILKVKQGEFNEQRLLKLADIVVPVSEKEANIVRSLIESDTSVQVIGHVIELDVDKHAPFEKRNGILFLASFGNTMYYNGDAIWYFLKAIYPLILKDSPIPLTIAGRGIPDELRNYTKEYSLDDHVTFLESVEDILILYESHRVFIAPHLYGAGIQFKLSESLSRGIPTVMSKISAQAFGINQDDEVTCIGDTPELFKSCVISIHNSKKAWSALQANGFDFIKRTHSREAAKKSWEGVIKKGLAKYEKELAKFEEIKNAKLMHECPEGETDYKISYPDVAEILAEGDGFRSAFDHWEQFGKAEGRDYLCNTISRSHTIFNGELWRPKPKAQCAIGEELYLQEWEDVAESVKHGGYESGFQHWNDAGYLEFRDYYCQYDLKVLLGSRAARKDQGNGGL